MMDEKAPPPVDLVLVGNVMKPYGLVGEVKVKPQTFDIGRHKLLKRVFFREERIGDAKELEVHSSRDDGRFWYLRFQGINTPEAAAHLSGGMLLIPAEQRLALPEHMAYLSDMPGMKVIDEEGKEVGTVREVVESAATDLLMVRTGRKEIVIPWNEHFVREVRSRERRVLVDMRRLRDLL